MSARVIMETRPAYTVQIGGKRRRFWTEAAAYYRLAASLLGQRYMAALRAYEADPDDFSGHLTACAEMLGLDVPRVVERAERGVSLFHVREDVSGYGHYETHFSSQRWQAYVRRVARKMRALDRARGAA